MFPSIRASRRLAARTASAACTTSTRCAPVHRSALVRRPTVGPSASSAPTVRRTSRASISAASIRAPAHAARTHAAWLSATIRSAAVCWTLSAIRLWRATAKNVSTAFDPVPCSSPATRLIRQTPRFVVATTVRPIAPANPCDPSPCGPNSQCRIAGDQQTAVCSCVRNYIGRAPNCRPECTQNPDCRGDRACINERCVDPCRGACGMQTTCTVTNHQPNCRCVEGYEGDPFALCSPKLRKNAFRSSSSHCAVAA